MKKVLVIQALHDDGLRLMRKRRDVRFEVVTDPTDSILRERIRDADATIVRGSLLTGSVIERASRLQIVSRQGSSVTNLDMGMLTARRIPVAISGDAIASSAAEQTLFLMLALAKHGLAHDAATRSDNFEIREDRHAIDLLDRVLLIIGFGRVGRQVAKRARAFGMRVLAHDPYVEDAVIEAHGVTPVPEFRRVLGKADFVSLHTQATTQTHNLIGADELALMKPTAFLVNAAWGGLVTETALFEALASGRLAGAGLDVFVGLRPSPDNPLLRLKNVVLSPHSGSQTREAVSRNSRMAVQNVLDAFDGTLNPEVVVNREVLKA